MSNPQNPLFDANRYVQQATQLASQLAEKQVAQTQSIQPMVQAFSATAKALAADPTQLMQRNLQLYQSHLALLANWMEKMMGRQPAPVATPEKDDRRFSNPAWDAAYFDLLKQSYLLTSSWLTHTVDSVRGLDPHTKAQAMFYTRQWVDALSPSNFLPTNPEALQTALSTNGESILQGFQNLMADLQRGRVSMTDYEKFQVGKTLATTEGQVVFRNKLVELIQYKPTTPKVNARPLLICPPWINRFYILDLQPQNSFVKYMVDQGFQVFMISWKNPTADYRDVTFEDYIQTGLLEAIDATRAISGSDDVNTIGYCIGGTMMACALSILNAKKDKRINAATFFTTLLDFKDAGELSVFIDEEQLSALEHKMQREGVLDGRDMAGTFSSLRANDLIWSFVVNNYLLGKQPFPFDILYWNDDSTRMPCAMHSWYLRQLYQHNNLIKGNVRLLGQKVDVTSITQPLYMVSAINDHITPWASCYTPFARMASPSKRFVLSKAGHVAGVVNPPTAPGKEVKRSFWVAEAKSADAEAWLKTATATPDSWWPDYTAWLKDKSGAEVEAPSKLGNKEYKPLGAAPGTYVLEK